MIDVCANKSSYNTILMSFRFLAVSNQIFKKRVYTVRFRHGFSRVGGWAGGNENIWIQWLS